MESEITYFGQTNFRNQQVKFGIKNEDRRRHIYIIGQTGTGKTTLMKNMVLSDIYNGQGFCLIDPHGEFADQIIDYIPEERVKDVIYFNPSDTDWPVAFNVMERVPLEYRYFVASGLMSVFKKIWPDVWSARMEYILNNTILALLEHPHSTLLGINRLLSDKDYRAKVISYITDPIVKSFWVSEFNRYHERFATEAIAPIQNKAGQFISNPLIRNIIGQEETRINFREIMDEGKIFIANLSKGLIGEDNSALLGALLITQLQKAAMSRVDTPEEERRDFFLYVDEFQNFSTESFVNILSEARKYRLSLILAHQYISQLLESVRDAIFGNVGTLIAFRVGPDDAEFLENQFAPIFNNEDLVNLPNYNFCIKMMIDGIPSPPFTAINIPPVPPQGPSFRSQIIELTHKLYCRPRQEVETEISHWAALDFSDDGKESKKKVRYDGICDICGRPAKVPFEPDNERPVYCKECYEKIRRKEIPPLTAKPQKNYLKMEDILNQIPISLKEKKKKETEEKSEPDSLKENKAD